MPETVSVQCVTVWRSVQKCDSKMKTQHVYIIHLILMTIVNSNYADRSCKIPNAGGGTCTMLAKCPPLLEISEKKYKTANEHVFLAQVTSACSTFSSIRIKVCCPPESKWSTLTAYPVDYKPIRNAPQTELSQENEDPKDVTVSPDDLKQIEIERQLEQSEKLQGNPTMRIDNERNDNDQTECGKQYNTGDTTKDSGAPERYLYPWLALLHYEDVSRRCEGSLVTSRHVLTAASCVTIERPSSVRLGEYDTTPKPNDIMETADGGFEFMAVAQVADCIPHPDYDPLKMTNDIALVNILTNVYNMTDLLRTICLPIRDYVLTFTEDTSLIVAGWDSDQSDVKRDAIVPYVPREKCQSRVFRSRRRNYHLRNTYVCTSGAQGSDEYRGNTGSPLMYEGINGYVLVGIVAGPKLQKESQSSVYTYVHNYMDWINREISGRG